MEWNKITLYYIILFINIITLSNNINQQTEDIFLINKYIYFNKTSFFNKMMMKKKRTNKKKEITKYNDYHYLAFLARKLDDLRA